MTIKHLAYRIGHDFLGSVAGLASLMGKSEQVLQNKLNPNSTTHFLTIAELETMADFASANLQVARYFATKARAVVVQMPDVPESDMALLDAFMIITHELGEASSKFQQAYADGDINQKEFKDICTEIDDVVRSLLQFKACVGRVVR